MRTNRVKLDEDFEFVKQRRNIISPNFSFMGQLLQCESQVLAPHCSAEAGALPWLCWTKAPLPPPSSTSLSPSCPLHEQCPQLPSEPHHHLPQLLKGPGGKELPSH
ncbi:Hypothetical predicted protein [Marmota monax]|uniref:Dual specificity phosphatase catalytic domain-containing protein n=1 Tax=Marmota monax TaxID=9995 RepID=A0A5E4C9W4_MARMO|nr:hypothetical protein GHT09_007534 [Marmota monax]VTJ78618.1 Hypothetical predicted protein [Marmota monax]